MLLAAARITEPTGVIDHTLYWASVTSDEEALYLCAVLNSARTTELVRPLMSYGKDERHIDKAVWRLPSPAYDPSDDRHPCFTELGRHAEEVINALPLDEGKYFVSLRRTVRRHLASSKTGGETDEFVDELIANVPLSRLSPGSRNERNTA